MPRKDHRKRQPTEDNGRPRFGLAEDLVNRLPAQDVLGTSTVVAGHDTVPTAPKEQESPLSPLEALLAGFVPTAHGDEPGHNGQQIGPVIPAVNKHTPLQGQGVVDVRPGSGALVHRFPFENDARQIASQVPANEFGAGSLHPHGGVSTSPELRRTPLENAVIHQEENIFNPTPLEKAIAKSDLPVGDTIITPELEMASMGDDDGELEDVLVSTPELDSFVIENSEPLSVATDRPECFVWVVDDGDGGMSSIKGPCGTNSRVEAKLDKDPKTGRLFVVNEEGNKFWLIGTIHSQPKRGVASGSAEDRTRRRENREAEWPGEGDFKLLADTGLPVFYKTPSGAVRVLEQIGSGRYRIRTLVPSRAEQKGRNLLENKPDHLSDFETIVE